MSSRRVLIAVSAVTLVLLAISGIEPFDRLTWLLEVSPVLIALPLLWATHGRYPLTNFLYVWIALHAAVLILGGAYTYARVPLGFELQELLGTARNPYDKIGHFFQGFVPALVAREILIRGRFVRGARMLAFIVVCIVLAISAVYELIEWAFAAALGQGADDFLGTQGDEWDTQADMLFALLGAAAALLAFSRLHDSRIAAIMRPEAR